jgi:signal transduction histidine kinase
VVEVVEVVLLALVPFLLSYLCGVRLSLRWSALAVGALGVLLQLAAGFEDFPNFEILFLTLAPWWVGRQVRVRRLLVRELTARTNELEAEQDGFARLSVRRERARIARELHDIVAHHLAVIVVQAGAGRLASNNGDVGLERLSSIRESGRQALAEMSRLVDIIQADSGSPQDGRDALRALLDQAHAGGLDLEVSPLPDEVPQAAVSVVREGLTNAIKHAPGARVRVRLSRAQDGLEVEVRDDGGDPPSGLARTGSGMGLTGMRERLESLGGTLEAGPSENGWRLRARVPHRTSPGSLPRATTQPPPAD